MKRRRVSVPVSAVIAAITFSVFAACHKHKEEAPKVVVRNEWPMPDADGEAPCSDVGDSRVCRGGAATARPRALPRRAPPFVLSSLGFRTVGSGRTAKLVDRARSAPPFTCEGDICRQSDPRLPDEGEWECADFAAIVVCHGGLAPAGVPPGATDPGYTCGPRRTTGGAKPERVCVDTSPDMPGGAARGYRCRFMTEHGFVRECRRDATAQSVTDQCGATTDCTTGLTCVAGRCLPSLLVPACWANRDCGNGICQFGACVAEPP